MLSPLADASLEARGFTVSPAGSVGSQACRPQDDARPIFRRSANDVLSPLADESLETRGFKVSPAGSVGSQRVVHWTTLGLACRLTPSSALF